MAIDRKERARRNIEAYIDGLRENPKVCLKTNMVKELEKEFGVRLIKKEHANGEFYMYEIILPRSGS